MWVKYKGKRIKNIPVRYKDLSKRVLVKMFKDSEKTRLTKVERFTLELKYFKTKLKDLYPYHYELIEGHICTEVEEVHTNEGGLYYVALFERNSHRIRVKCSVLLYKLSPIKGTSYKSK